MIEPNEDLPLENVASPSHVSSINSARLVFSPSAFTATLHSSSRALESYAAEKAEAETVGSIARSPSSEPHPPLRKIPHESSSMEMTKPTELMRPGSELLESVNETETSKVWAVGDTSQLSRAALSSAATEDPAATRYVEGQLTQQQKKYKVRPDSYWTDRLIKNHANFGPLYIFFIGVSAPCGAIYTTWGNTLQQSGTLGLLLAIICIGLGFVCLCCCLGEMSSAFPFAGGSFGFARALLGNIPGQIVGVAEYLEWILIGVGFVSLVSQGMTTMFGTDPLYEGLWLVLLYGLSLFLNLMGGYFLYVPFAINTIVSIVFLVVYQLGMIRYGNWQANAGIAPGMYLEDGVTPATRWFINGFSGFLQALPYAVFTLVGFEICPLVADEVHEPKRAVPRGMISASVLVCGMAVLTIIAALSCPQLSYGDLASTAFPLTDGYALIFGGPSASGVGGNPRLSIVLPVFTQWAAFMTCVMAWGRQSFAMARSGLLPHWLSLTWKRRGTPAAALTAGAVLSLSAALIVRFIGVQYTQIANLMLFNVGITGCCLNYLFQALSFIMLRWQYSALPRTFSSPLGIPGAVYVFIIYSLTLAGIFQYPYFWQSLLAMALVLTAGMLYYALWARTHMYMSPEEYRSLFVVYSMKFVRQKAHQVTKGSAKGSTDRHSRSLRPKMMSPAAVAPAPARVSNRSTSVR